MEHSEGLVLRLVPYREADVVATLYTRAHGRITALARAARRSRRRFGAALGHLVVSQFGLRPRTRGDLWTLESAEIQRDFTALAGNLAAFSHASYVIDLVMSLTPVEAPEPAILDLAIELHEALARSGPSPAALRGFELALLDTLGSAPVLDACAACARADELDRGGVLFDPGRGGVICPRCAPASRGAQVRPLSPGARAHLLALRGVAIADAHALDGHEDAAEARDAMLAMLTGLVGHPLRSVEFIAKLNK